MRRAVGILVLGIGLCWAVPVSAQISAATHLVALHDATDLSSYATASITPTGDRLVMAFFFSTVASGTPNTPTATGNGITWTAAGTFTSGTRRITLLCGSTASPSAGSITFDLASQTQTNGAWSVFELTGASTAASCAGVIQTQGNTGTGTPASVTLAAFGSASNGTVSAVFNTGGALVTPGTGFTEINDTSTGIGKQTQWRADNDTSVDATIASSQEWFMLGAEVAPPSGSSAGYKCLLLGIC